MANLGVSLYRLQENGDVHMYDKTFKGGIAIWEDPMLRGFLCNF